METAIENFVTT